ncbi:phosphotransferase [Leptolyngbya sp. FACHB-36]|uniref:phosphotransferase enzyme family protein n=1 Tax=Leptolyngbya sp. FACHB-36 TaxID=2692808 RepID=UPI0016814330|nr:phosphotransferase [Leptolyngbya sp. FACHB-36]MBD2020921.1 phosphotransferase [Leptolyngbya sp. FACHB-36]
MVESGIIRVRHSLPLEADLLAIVVPQFAMPPAQRCRLLKRGLNDTYLVETETAPYILRLYRHTWRTKTEIDFELQLLRFLGDRLLPVAAPIETKQEELTTTILAPEGTRYAAVFPYAPGEAVEEQLTQTQSHQLGALTAQIHEVSNEFQSCFHRPELNREYLLDWAWTWISALFETVQQDSREIQAEIARIKVELDDLNLPIASPIYGICVGDVHAGNTHFVENAPTLFDFDQCGYGWRAFDIAKFLHVCLTRNIAEPVRRAFLQGYQTVRELTALELAAIPVFIRTAHIWVLGINASVAGEVVPYGHYTPAWFNDRLARLHQLHLLSSEDVI